jgi:hypothetical protein
MVIAFTAKVKDDKIVQTTSIIYLYQIKNRAKVYSRSKRYNLIMLNLAASARLVSLLADLFV